MAKKTNNGIYQSLTGSYDLPKLMGVTSEELEGPENAMLRRVLLSIQRRQTPLIINNRKHIQLRQEQSIEAMAGYQFAVDVYENQILPYLTDDDFKNGFTLHMPAHVFLTTDSFLDYIIGETAHRFDNVDAFSHFEFHSEDEHVQSDINDIINEYHQLLSRTK